MPEKDSLAGSIIGEAGERWEFVGLKPEKDSLAGSIGEAGER